MQQNNQTNIEFIRRTDELAHRLGLNLSELPTILGFSKPSLFAYRSGKNRITPKVWLKLEKAEREAGVIDVEIVHIDQNAERESKVKDFHDEDTEKDPAMMRDHEVPYRFTPKAGQCQGHEPEEAAMLTVLTRIAESLEKLVDAMNANNLRK